MTYEQFLNAKVPCAELAGFEPLSPAHPSLFPHQRDIAQWMCRGGRRACFAAFGLGKTRINLQVAKWVTEFCKTGKFLIIAPLGVRQEFISEQGPELGLTDIKYVRNDVDVNHCDSRIVITNYERVRDGDITIDERFIGVSLDEASVLRSFGSKTYQTFLDLFAAGKNGKKGIRFRFVFTATPSPNKHKELIHYGGFLGVMDTGEALTRFFKRNSTQANDLTLYPHMEEQFWRWLATWAVFMQKPSDLGYSDEGYDLPPLEVIWKCVPVDHKKAWEIYDGWGQAQLFLDKTSGLRDNAIVKRETMIIRVEAAKNIMTAHTGEHFVIWHDLEDERRLLEKAIPEIKTAYGNQPLPDREEIIYGFCHGQFSTLGTKPSIAGSGTNFQRHCHNAIFLGSTYKFNDFIQSIHRIVRFGQTKRCKIWIIYTESEDPVIAELKRKWAQHDKLVEKMSGLLRELKLTLNPDMQLKRTNQSDRLEVVGKNFRVINNDSILELMPSIDFGYNNDDRSSKEMAQGSPKGVDGIPSALPAEKSGEEAGARAGVVSEESGEVHREIDCLSQSASSKTPGDKQKVCAKASREDSRQNAGVVSKEQKAGKKARLGKKSETILRDNKTAISSDDKSAESSVHNLSGAIIHETETASGSLSQNNESKGDYVQTLQQRSRVVSRQQAVNGEGDSVSEWKPWDDNCVDLIVSSIPFGTQYEYTTKINDLGHNPSNEDFFKQLDFLIPNLLRVLKPGRIACIHVKDRIRFGNVTGLGMPTVDPFSDDTSTAFRKHGFKFMGRITIDTDVVRENNQTYRLGWTEACKDMTKMGVGMSEYVMIFRKPQTDQSKGFADIPVAHEKEKYGRGQWQVDAAALWKSDGNRLPDPAVLVNMSMQEIGKLWKQHCFKLGYSYREHVKVCAELEKCGKLPASFMLFPPVSRNNDIWTDIVRMRTLNSEQSRRNQEHHVCPLQLDIVERLINRFSNPGEIVLDPFNGIGTVTYQAIHQGRIGWGIELNTEYWHCSVGYCEQAEVQRNAPTLFDLQQYTRETEIPVTFIEAVEPPPMPVPIVQKKSVKKTPTKKKKAIAA